MSTMSSEDRGGDLAGDVAVFAGTVVDILGDYFEQFRALTP